MNLENKEQHASQSYKRWWLLKGIEAQQSPKTPRHESSLRQDFDNCLRPVALLSEGEHRRLWRFIMEL